MTEALVIHLSDLDNIQFEEFYDFFCLDLSTKSREILQADYNSIKGNKKDVSFEDIARNKALYFSCFIICFLCKGFYCENYKEIIDILELLNVANARIDDFLAKRNSAKRQNYPKELIEKLLFHDIENNTRTIFNSIIKLTNRYDNALNSFVNEVELAPKLEELLGTLQKLPLDEAEPSRAQDERIKYEKVNELQQKLNDLQSEINSFKQYIKYEDAASEEKESYTENNIIRPTSSNYPKKNNYVSVESEANEEKTDNLTGHVWPKSRMLLAIVSKMSKEGLLNQNQKGLLKDLIIENDERILQCLKQYELDGDRKNLYKSCLVLASASK